MTMTMTMSAPPPYLQTQPKLSRFTLSGLIALPRRLCSPPAAVGKVRSFGLTPIFDIKLDDVLDRKHLPPLSLKDFEEWLLFVEQSVENLYFILWLREYTAKYDRWVAKVRTRESKARRSAHAQSQSAYRVAWSATTPTSPALALFFSRARETFLVPGAPYELSLPPALLDALAVANGHPDPVVLAPARAYVEKALRGSLSRCVRAAYSNVGTYRAACGIAAGIFILLVGTVPPLTVNFLRGQNRWERLVILPGLWLGLTILIASLRGICMMIYIFGDFRQLRKFELVRPPPPASPRESESFEDDDFSPDLVAPTRPVRALTAPPKIAIRIPTRTPTLSYGATSVSITTEVYVSGTDTDSSYTNTTSHVPTISISSLKSRGGASTLDAETLSVPACRSDDSVMGESEDEDAMSTASDHGIYISPAMPSPDTAAEEDPAVRNAALALLASGALDGTAGDVSGSVSVPSVPPIAVASVPTPAKTQTKESVPMPTATFIPAYSDTGATHRRRSHSRSRSRSGDSRKSLTLDRDLEAGGPSASAAPCSTSSRISTFDFDGLPPPPAPSVPHPRTRAPDACVDIVGLETRARMDRDEKALLSPSDRYSFGLGTTTGTEYDPTSPARTDDAAGLCEKGGPSSRAWAEHAKHGSGSSQFTGVLGSVFRFRHFIFPFSQNASSRSSTYDTMTSDSALSHENKSCTRRWRTRWAQEGRVPAFGPVTRVLAPVVARAQWEIVVRAAGLAALAGAVVGGVIVVLPVPAAEAR